MMRITKTDDINKCLQLRYEVFVDEQNVPFELEKDERDEIGSGCDHFLIEDDDGVCATFRCFMEDDETLHVQRLCVKKTKRKTGMGRAALEFAEEYYRPKNIRRLTLDAQCRAIPFYEKCGFRVVSGIFDDAGIPHRTMIKDVVSE